MARANPLTNEQIERVISNMPTMRDRCMFVVGCRTGFRISELLSLTVEDVLQYGEIRDTVTVRRKNTKSKIESRTVALHNEAKKYLHNYITPEMKLKDKIFPICRQQVHRIIKSAVSASKVQGNHSAGSMRKSFAKKVYEALGRDLINTQRAMGHKSVASTAYYIHFDQDEVDKAILG